MVGEGVWPTKTIEIDWQGNGWYLNQSMQGLQRFRSNIALCNYMQIFPSQQACDVFSAIPCSTRGSSTGLSWDITGFGWQWKLKDGTRMSTLGLHDLYFLYLSYLNIFQVDATVMTSCLPIQSSWQSPFTSTTRSLPPFSRRAPCRPQGLAQIKECIDGEGDGPAQIIEITWDETAIDDHRWPLHNTHQQSTTW